MRYSELVSFSPIETVVQLQDADDASRARSLIETFVISPAMAGNLSDLIFPNLDFAVPADQKALLIVGNYGTGKSHVMAVISGVAEFSDLLTFIKNDNVREAAQAVAGRFEVLRTEIGATKMSLRDIIVQELDQFLRRRSIIFEFPPLTDATNSKDWLEGMMAAFQHNFPDRGLLIVVDELLDYLRGRDDREIVLDLTFLRELGEFSRDSRLRFIAGIQESLFDSPRFEFAASQVNRVRARFVQVPIVRDDVSYVVSERLLAKTVEQQQRIEKHLEAVAPLYEQMGQRMDEFVRLFPVHPSYLEVFEQVRVVEKREALRSLSRTLKQLIESGAEVGQGEPGIVSFDSYWAEICSDAAMRAHEDIRKVEDTSSVLEAKVRASFPRPIYLPLALRVIHALSVHRLTAPDIRKPFGLTARELLEQLCLYIRTPETDADFLRTTVESVLDQIGTTVNRQFISKAENDQYYIDVEKTVDYEAQVEKRALSLSDPQRDKAYYAALLRALEQTDNPYVSGFQIWEYEVDWPSRRVKRPGYLFFGSPRDRSTAQPPREFYVYFLPAFGDAGAYETEADEVYFELARRDEDFESELSGYAAASELAFVNTGDERRRYGEIAEEHLGKVAKWLSGNLATTFRVSCRGQSDTPIGWLSKAPGPTPNVRDLVNSVASACLAPRFDDQLPHYPAFSVLVTRQNRPEYARRALESLPRVTRTDTEQAVLRSLQLLDENDNIDARNSPYARWLIDLLEKKGAGQVVNRGEVISGPIQVEKDSRFGLEPEWVAVVLGALVYSGEVVVALKGAKADATNIDKLIGRPLDDWVAFQHFERPRELPYAALLETARLFRIPDTQVQNPLLLQQFVVSLQTAAVQEMERAVAVQKSLENGIPSWGGPALEGPRRDEAESAVNNYKVFLEGLQAYNTPGKLKNFKSTVEDVRTKRRGKELLQNLTVLQREIVALGDICAYLDQASAILSEENPLRIRIVDTQQRFLNDVRDPSRIAYDDLGHRWRRDLEALRADYEKQYTVAHTDARLNLADDRRKVALQSGEAAKRLVILAAIPIVPRQEFDNWRARLAALRSCPGLPAATLQTTPVCPECNYRPAVEPHSGAALSRLNALSEEIEQIETRWIELLLTNLKDPAALANIQLLDAPQQAMVERFVQDRRLPSIVDSGFAGAITEALSSLEPVSVSGPQLIDWVTAEGMPCTPEEIRRRFARGLKDLLLDKDEARVRILLLPGGGGER